MCAPLCIDNRPVAIVPVAPSRRRRPSRKSAALGADDEAMEWKRRSPGSSGAEAEVISFVHVGAFGHELAVGLNRNALWNCAAQRVTKWDVYLGRNRNQSSSGATPARRRCSWAIAERALGSASSQ
jgi:hypothetical protein